jgi:hypothetical protein
MVTAAAAALAVACQAAPSATFYPSTSSAQRFEPKASVDDIQILPSAPADNAVILGELRIEGGDDASLHGLMVAALCEAANRGASFVALAGADNGPGLVLGKMVPAGHGRSMFMVGPVLGSEVGRIAAIPAGGISSIRVVLGRFSTSGT